MTNNSTVENKPLKLTGARRASEHGQVELTFNQPPSSARPPHSAWTVLVDGTDVTNRGASPDFYDDSGGNDLNIQLKVDLATGDHVTVIYRDPTPDDDDNALQNAFGRDVDSFCVSFSVGTGGFTRCAPDETRPRLESVEVDASNRRRLVLTFDETLSSEEPPSSRFRVWRGGSLLPPLNFTTGDSGKELHLTYNLAINFADGNRIRIYYSDSTALVHDPGDPLDFIKDLFGNIAASFCVEFTVGTGGFETCTAATAAPRVTGMTIDSENRKFVLTFDRYLASTRPPLHRVSTCLRHR